MNIVIKENRKRYQKEQFDRMLLASQDFDLKSQSASMEAWCVNYCKIIELMIE